MERPSDGNAALPAASGAAVPRWKALLATGQVYSAKYNTISRCKYYLSSVSDDIATLEDVTNSVDKIYAKLSYPLQQLENERWMS